MRHNAEKDAPRFDVQLLFPEIGVLLDDHQFRDTISLFETIHLLRRKSRVRGFTKSLFIVAPTSDDVVCEISTSRRTSGKSPT